MTAYRAQPPLETDLTDPGGIKFAQQFVIKANSFPIKFKSMSLGGTVANPQTGGGNAAPGPNFLYRVAGATVSGGTSFTPLAMREGAPASTVTVLYRQLNSPFSTTTLNFSQGTPVTVTGTRTLLVATGSPGYSPLFEFIIQPGTALYGVVAGGETNTAGPSYKAFNSISFYYEELRLSWSV